jgi:hypothetical protein
MPPYPPGPHRLVPDPVEKRTKTGQIFMNIVWLFGYLLVGLLSAILLQSLVGWLLG